jgi:hypothetical protein
MLMITICLLLSAAAVDQVVDPPPVVEKAPVISGLPWMIAEAC